MTFDVYGLAADEAAPYYLLFFLIKEPRPVDLDLQ
jgi:hypothetical protein